MHTVSRLRAALLVLLGLGTACSVQQTAIPGLSGPSDFALSINLTATPDIINQDGLSQAVVVVVARGPNGEALSSVPIRLDLAVGGVFVDFGTLSSKNIVTGADGRATAVYTAPPAPPAGTGGAFQVVTVIATPGNGNYQAASSSSADIRLNTPGVIIPPGGAPTASFTISPSSPAVNTEVFFDASGSTPGSGSSAIVSYDWSFGDGASDTGIRPDHVYGGPGTFTVTLRVTNDRGLSATASQSVTVGTGPEPTAAFVFSPTAPVVSQTIFFDASTSRAAQGRIIVAYQWNFGDGGQGSGQLPTHSYDLPGAYSVTLTVTDHVGLSDTTAVTVTVGSGAPVANFTISPTPPVTVGTLLTFDGSSSQAFGGSTITSYAWAWGDLTADGAGVSATHAFGVAGTYTVTLTVADNAGRTAQISKSVTVE